MSATRQPPYGGGDILMTVGVIAIGCWILIVLATQVWHTNIAPPPANSANTHQRSL